MSRTENNSVNLCIPVYPTMSPNNISNEQKDVKTKNIKILTKLLRNYGDKVLSASSKLSLTTDVIADLNAAFAKITNEPDDIESSFQVCNSSRSELFQDIKFLHDFVQKTIGLKIMQNNLVQIVDITKFRHLKYLEMHKVPTEMVKGIQGIRGQLEGLVCAGGRGVKNVYQILAACGGDKGAGFIWGSLHRLGLPYNALSQLDKSLEFAPWLESIDFSHNLITKAAELECLPHLKNVNLSFNNLECVPCFNKTTYHNLQKLILKNNYINDINGLQGLECLIELDLSYNCLTDHSLLWPLQTMSMLVLLNLKDNPISFHPRHRLHTMKHLHPLLSDSKFMLDNETLNKAEKLFVSENRVFVMRSTVQQRREVMGGVEWPSLTTSVTSSEISRDGRMTKSQNSDVFESSVDITSSKSGAKKRRNMQEAIIDEDDLDRERFKPKPSSLSNSYFESSMDHLETKRKILELRAKYGEDNWLSSQSATCVQNIMGLQAPASSGHPDDVLLSSTFADGHHKDFLAASNVVAGTASISPILSILPSNLAQHNDQSSEFKNYSENLSDTAQVGLDAKSESTKEEEIVEVGIESECKDSNSTQTNVEMQETCELPYDPEEEKGDLYLVQKRKGLDEPDEIFLIITSEDIKERDSITGKIKYRWSTNTILSCVLGRGIPTTVDITFDTTRKDREARTYITEFEDAKKIVQTLNEMIKIQPMILKIFKCMKCSTHFSQDGDNNIVSSTSAGSPPKCPTCKSTLVIQTDDLTTPAVERLERIVEKSKVETQKELLNDSQLPHSSSQSSIGSATSLEESRESTPSVRTITKKYESDIEILSNPSQSSIEVLDDGSKSTTPHRKKSSEERRIAIAPSLLTIPDTTLVMTGLTESSSSGSLTDSVCTAYENKTIKLSDTTEMSNSKNISNTETIKDETLDSENTTALATNLSSMLGELLQSMKIGPSKETSLKSEDTCEFVGSNIQYSYTDYSNVDHRIKLHLVLNVFEHENEDLALLLRAEILTQSSIDPFPGCLVMSTAKVYILRITGPEGEDPQRWLHKESSWTIDRLRSFSPLPFKQGILVELQQPIKIGENPTNNLVLCILQDFQRTSNFLFYLTDSPLPASCEVEFTVPQSCNTSVKNILNSCKYHKEEDNIRLLAIFSSAVLKTSNDVIELKLSSLFITSSTLMVTQDKMHWLLPGNDKLPSIVAEQGMSNLIEVDFSKTSLTLNFLDEVAGVDACWTFNFVSLSAAETVINSIRPPWEELFSVPLQINMSLMADSSDSYEKT